MQEPLITKCTDGSLLWCIAIVLFVHKIGSFVKDDLSEVTT